MRGVTPAGSGSTAEQGGAYNGGGIFELVPSGNSYTESVLYSFCALSACADGQAPIDRLIMDTSGDLYGVTYQGGKYGDGMVACVLETQHVGLRLVSLNQIDRENQDRGWTGE